MRPRCFLSMRILHGARPKSATNKCGILHASTHISIAPLLVCLHFFSVLLCCSCRENESEYVLVFWRSQQQKQQATLTECTRIKNDFFSHELSSRWLWLFLSFQSIVSPSLTHQLPSLMQQICQLSYCKIIEKILQSNVWWISLHPPHWWMSIKKNLCKYCTMKYQKSN